MQYRVLTEIAKPRGRCGKVRSPIGSLLRTPIIAKAAGNCLIVAVQTSGTFQKGSQFVHRCGGCTMKFLMGDSQSSVPIRDWRIARWLIVTLCALSLVLSTTAVAVALTAAQAGYICGQKNCKRGASGKKVRNCYLCCAVSCSGATNGGCQDFCKPGTVTPCRLVPFPISR